MQSAIDQLAQATGHWSARVVVRNYVGPQGQKQYEWEAHLLGMHGYVPQSQSQDGGHVHVGRILLTGGLSVFAGQSGVRSNSTLTVTFVLAEPRPAKPSPRVKPSDSTVIATLRKLNADHTAGRMSDEEYRARKAELVALL